MFSRVPDKVWQALDSDIEERDLEYVDNHRAYRPADRFLLAEYCEAESWGCCGAYQSSVIIDGEEWVYACNHGH